MKTHIRIEKKDASKLVLVCGDPARAEVIASFLEKTKCLAKNREYHTYVGQYKGKKIMVTSHGVGSAGAGICFNELIDVGAKCIIRIGTAGGFGDNCKIGDLVVPTGAIRLDGVSRLMVPAEYPAVPDIELTQALITTCKKSKLPIETGIILTTNMFYPGVLENHYELYKKANAIAVEMECATLFVIGQLRKVKTASILALDGNPLKWEKGQYDPTAKKLHQASEKAIKAALETLANY